MQWNLKLTKILLVTIILVFMATTVKAEVDIKAESAILIEAKSGDIIHELNVDKKWYPASMTKLMTLAVVLDLLEKGQFDLNERVVTSENAASYGGAQLYLEPGEEFTLDDMLKAIIIGSANDASVAVAEHIAGSEQAFAELMNEKAKEIGALNTHFVNSHGLHDENHYTTAKDMALIGQYSLRFPKTLEYTSMQHCEFRKEPATERYSLNKLLWWYPGTDGFKTGTTSAAKRNFVGTVERDGLRLISVVMGVDEPNGHFRETMKLFNHGFANYIFKQFVAKNTVLGQIGIGKGEKDSVDVIAADNLGLSMPKGQDEGFELKLLLKPSIEAPVSKGTIAGELVITKGGSEIKRFELVTADSVQRGSFPRMLGKVLKAVFSITV